MRNIDGECLANDRQTTAAGSGAVISSHAQYVAFMLRGAAVLRWHQYQALYVPADDCASLFHAGITPLDHQRSVDNIAFNDSGAI